jgi:hypothetical protein
VRAAVAQDSRAEAIADFVQATRVRRGVLTLCEQELKNSDLPEDMRYWVLSTMAEAYLGVGERQRAEQLYEEAFSLAPATWMIESIKEQRANLEPLLADSPLKYVQTDAAP